MKEIKLVPGSCKECYFAEVKGCSVQCNLPSHHSCCNGKTCYKEVPVTNGEMVRKMDNDKMAWMFVQSGACPVYRLLTSCPHVEDEGDTPEVCHKCWLDWLEQEAKGVQ